MSTEPQPLDDVASRPVLRLMSGRDRRVKAGHPWAFSNEIAMTAAARALPPGTPVRLEGDDGVKHGTWLFNPHSLIAARRLSADPGMVLGAAYFRARLGECMALRDRLVGAPFYRLVHAEADGLPGLVIDRYGDALALQANTAGMDRATPLLVAALRELIDPRVIVARNDSAVRGLEGLKEESGLLHGEDATARVREGGLDFSIDLLSGQKTGWFFDQRDNRAHVAALASGATMLDAFCHTGGFGLLSAQAGARQVTLLDRSEHALALAMETARRHGFGETVSARRGDAMEVMENMIKAGQSFDIVVADPPAFAKARKDHPAAMRGYSRLARLAAQLVAPGGYLFMASCSHHVSPGDFTDAVAQGVARTRRPARLLATTGAGMDHPVHPLLPESAYLKGLLLHLPA
ncbi:class I SAM-dependent rRNA methyltransferase [Roseomonas marmotae]|uniref:Class I SAM-dependent rRNA methyltransferase n=1 Tax=Roseomonas marmotae TaxID=2768161 RepID=A0ABS3KD36_9PROT|nr:class I SAM-dependent rRNA methyltransferase [Roseomonas marmotae]MBO1075382.1 class I SAM-dependent rRNA methyltransferase [Roseomonas marmotae]QTI78371.1 class I SAM-dependent rRNA methyltransferase [Roseomonas marmotae]